jgi:hypothetical protein
MHVATDWTATICTADGCDKPRTGVFHTLCRTHYEKSRRQRSAELAPLGYGKRCSLADCERMHHAKGLCRLHYGRQLATGSTELKPVTPKAKPSCSVVGCAKDAKTLGYCGSHYSNYRKHGVVVVPNTRGPRGEPKLDKFARHLTADDERGCWLYAGIINKDGYGKFNLGQGRGEVKAHRWLYQELTGKTLTRAVQLDHTCEVPHCVRPSHLLEVTPAQHNAHTAARRKAPAGMYYRADESPRSLTEVAYAITHRLPMVWNQ